MKKTRDSLGGQNSNRRISGARSSRALSTIFHKLRKLDKRISILDHRIKFNDMGLYEKHIKMIIDDRARLDMKRKQLRLQRKGYE